ncbi:putative UDP-glucosyltransferase YojK [Brevipalpus obovatus]|uniref:putative UDP-glucosyltransferase YojK n=1 Tax=Brevipalpus obovatus TaxID=246614 RepID=UPI003D9FAC6B
MAEKPLRALVSSIAARGHLNCAIGFGHLLKKRGHKILFAQREVFRDMIERHGFEFIPFDEKVFGTEDTEPFNDWIRINSHIFRKDGVERYRNLTPKDRENFSGIVGDRPYVNKALANIFKKISNIDVVVTDVVSRLPSIDDSGIPHVSIMSLAPLDIYPNGVPAYAGFSKKDEAKFEDYRELYRDVWSVGTDQMREWFRSCGKDDWADEFDPWNFVNQKVELGFYHYAEDLDYHEFGPTYPNWYRVDFCVRESQKKFDIPSKLQNLPGKLIFFSMGSLASMDHEIMKMLLKVLSKSPHRFIVSTGACGDELELYDNMWGEPYVDQIAVLQTVDVVITHGGNNSLMETLYYGRPMIVIPYFFDQLDNAQRVEEKQVGRRINIWDFDEEKLLNTIEEVANSNEMRENVKRISQNMRKSTSREEAAKRIEKFVETKLQSKRKA